MIRDEFDRTLSNWFTEDTRARPPGGVERVLDVTQGLHPRPGWIAGLGSHWVGDAGSPVSRRTILTRSGRWSIALLAALAIALITILAGGAILVGALRLPPPTVPPSPVSHLAYGLNGSIYIADADGANPVRIATGVDTLGGGGPTLCGTFWGQGAIWSPDGRYLAFRSGGDPASCATGGRVQISDWRGHLVASFPGSGWFVAWSPDSTRLATKFDLDRTIAVYAVDGTREELITVPPNTLLPGDFDPKWAPDGKALLYPAAVVGSPPGVTQGPSNTTALAIPVNGDPPRLIPTTDPLSYWTATDSPDGTKVAYNNEGNLFVSAASVVVPRQVVTAGLIRGACCPIWSPAGDRIAIDPLTSDATPASGVVGTDVALVDVASGRVTPLTGAGLTDALNVIRFSPDGSQVLFSRTTQQGVVSLWSVQTDGSGSQLLVSGTDWGDWEPMLAGH